MADLTGKKLLVLGGTSASLDVVKEAKRLGIHVTVVDDRKTGVSKEIADESYIVSTTDIDGLKKLIKEKHIDGAFCGPSEFNIINTMNICEASGLPFYATREQWNICSNKASFKKLCRKFDVPAVPEYQLTEECLPEDLDKIKYPVIVKPVDGRSSIGVSVCRNEEEVKAAIPLALKNSRSRKFIVEKFITSDHGFGCRYIANDGEIYLSAVNDRYTVDTNGGKAMISNVAIYPSKKIDYFIETINPKVIEMFKSIGIKNGTFFMQALIDDGQIYFHEMGLRLSGGLLYKIFKSTCGFSDLEMMIRCALGGPMCTEDEIEKIDPYLNGKFAAILCVPLKAGTIGSIKGLNKILQSKNIVDFIQYYQIGEEITEDKIGTLLQHFCRFKFIANSKNEIVDMIDKILNLLTIEDTEGNNMIYAKFDTKRLF